MAKWESSLWGDRRKKGKCKACKKGQVWEYENYGMGSTTIKCDLCGDSQEDY